jgi:predicted acyl esterase
MKKIIHVNQHVIKRNTKHGTDEPVLTVKTYKENNYAHEAIIKTRDGVELAKVVYSPHNPLSCGARVWIELDTMTTDVELIVRQGETHD